MGRSEAGKTTLTQALRGEEIHYYKTQDVHYYESVIDTPGEYAQSRRLGKALALYTYEADIVGLLIASDYPYNPFPPCCTSSCNREVIGLVTGIDKPEGDPDRVEGWLRLAGCKTVFRISSYTGQGLREVIEYLDDANEANKEKGVRA